MRAWLTPRCILVVAMLVLAPGAAIAHLLLTWFPGTVAVAALRTAIDRDAARAEQTSSEIRDVQRQLAAARAGEQAESQRPVAWLPQRDRYGVLEQLSLAVDEPGVTVEQLAMHEPKLFCAVSRQELLACEKIALRAAGDYVGLTHCLERIANLGLPMRVTAAAWQAAADKVHLVLELEVPFAPDDKLREALADEARLGKSE